MAWLIGVPWHDCGAIGNLLGTRMALNEVIAYIGLGAQKATLAPRSFIIATFALCGFANLGSIGMQIGGIGALVPERRNDLARLGVRAMLAGTMANLISASIAGCFWGSLRRFLEHFRGWRAGGPGLASETWESSRREPQELAVVDTLHKITPQRRILMGRSRQGESGTLP